MTVIDTPGSDLRERAIKKLKDRKDFHMHLLIFVLVNSFLISIWAITTPGGFFWPMFPILGWGIGLAFNIWDVYSPRPSEDRIRREMDRLRGS